MQFTLTPTSNSAQLSIFNFNNQKIRVIEKDGEPWFVARDVCKAIDVKNTTDALKSLNENERARFNLGRQGFANLVSESGLYVLILRCRNAVTKGSPAYNFRLWVTQEVLPAIRKTGKYIERPQLTQDGRCPYCGLRPLPKGSVVLFKDDCENLLKFIYYWRFLFRDSLNLFSDLLHKVKSPMAGRFHEAVNDTQMFTLLHRLENAGYKIEEDRCFRAFMNLPPL